MTTSREILRTSAICLTVCLLSSCSHPTQTAKPPPPAPKSSNAPIAAGPLMDEHISFEFAVYYLPRPTQDPLAELDLLLNDKGRGFRRVNEVKGTENSRTLSARLETDAGANYPPLDPKSLQYFGRGLSQDQAERLQKTESVLIVDFAYPKKHVFAGLRSAQELTLALAQATGGLIWDEMTRETFSPEAWQKSRIAEWNEEVPNATKHTVIHSYKDGEYVRAITLGMEKFGLPDIVVEDFSWSLNRNVGHIINLFSQALVEGTELTKPGEFDLDFRTIKNAKVRDPQVSTLKPNGTGIALLALRKGTWEEGDPSNRLIEITFERGTGPDVHAQQEQVVSAAFGWEDSITRIKHDEALLEVSRKARSKLPSLRKEFNKGLAPGEFIQVKAPFETPEGGHEWMWVEITVWKGDKIGGILRNEPFDIPDLHAGQVVEVSEAEAFDYLRTHADGTVEGNETSVLIEQQSQNQQ